MIKRFFWFLVIAGVLLYLYATHLGIKGLEVHEYVIESESIPTSYNGFTIAHFSDLLYGSTTNIDDVRALVDKINSYNPDIVVFTGNLISNDYNLEKDDKDELIHTLKNLDPKQKKFAIYSSMDEIKIERFKEIIDEYTVYSTEISQEMAYNVFKITSSDYAVGITGMLGTIDPYNESNEINKVYISIYEKESDEYFNYKLNAIGNNRLEKKNFIINFVKEKLYELCKWKIGRIMKN